MILDGDSFLSLDIQPMGVWVLRMGGDVVALSDYKLKTSRSQSDRTNSCYKSDTGLASFNLLLMVLGQKLWIVARKSFW